MDVEEESTCDRCGDDFPDSQIIICEGGVQLCLLCAEEEGHIDGED